MSRIVPHTSRNAAFSVADTDDLPRAEVEPLALARVSLVSAKNGTPEARNGHQAALDRPRPERQRRTSGGNPFLAADERSTLEELAFRSAMSVGETALQALLYSQGVAVDPRGGVAGRVRMLFASRAMVGALESSTRGFFGREYATLLADDGTGEFLSSLNTSFAAGQPVHVWQHALEHTDGDEALATRLLAVLFQDTFPAAHTAPYPELNAALGDAIDQVLGNPQVELYPDEVGPLERRTTYHYYVIRHLSAKLRERGYPPFESFLLPFIFNTSYELLPLEGPLVFENMPDLPPQDASFADKVAFLGDVAATGVGDLGGFLTGPERNFDNYYTGSPMGPDRGSRIGTLQDIYLGYAGAWTGAGLPGTPMSYTDFEAQWLKETPTTFRNVIAAAAAEPG